MLDDKLLEPLNSGHLMINPRVKNPGHAESGCKKLFVNGQEMKDNYIPQTVLTDETDIELIMS